MSSLIPIRFHHGQPAAGGRSSGPARSAVPGILFASLLLFISNGPIEAAQPSFAPVHQLFSAYCLDCHSSVEPDGDFVIENFESLLKGGASGPALVPGESEESLLVKFLEGRIEKDGRKQFMPPGRRKKLEPEQIQVIREWIDAGAPPPTEGELLAAELVVPRIEPRVPPRNAINAILYTTTHNLLILGRHAEVELRDSSTRRVVRALSGHRGPVNSLVASPDRSQLFAAAGEPHRFGEVRQWNIADGDLIRVFEGHADSIYTTALSPDGSILATGSYDQKIKLWSVETGLEIRTLTGHNGAVFGLAFRPDGRILASASADRTVKLWDVETGERRETFSQPLKELYAVAFSPDGRRLAAGGADNRIRVWQISERATETTNPLLYSRYAHEGAILRLAYSRDGRTLVSAADDRTVKIWEAAEMRERLLLDEQPDWPSAIAIAADDSALIVGRLDGSFDVYNPADGNIVPPAKPELSRIEPRSMQRGVETKLKLVGKNISGANEVKFNDDRIAATFHHDGASPDEVWVLVTTAGDLPRGNYEIQVAGPSGESAKQTLYIDDLPQIHETPSQGAHEVALPATFWGTLESMGDVDELVFEANAGQTVIFDVAAQSIGSKANVMIALLDSTGRVLAANSRFDGHTDPFLAHTFAVNGSYTLRISDETAAGSPEHAYRVVMGELPFVTAFFPLSVSENAETDVELAGFNLPPDKTIRVTAGKPGELSLPLDLDHFRTRRDFKLLVSAGSELIEAEPNDTPEQATSITIPGVVNGRIWNPRGGPDVDLFRFESKAGTTWTIETDAARRGSPIDTRIEVLYEDGRPIERLLFQAVRDSQINFRPIDSNSGDVRVDNWEEMELNQWMYMQGEICKIFRMPEGPDSGFQFYRNGNRRIAWFDTSPMAHSLNEPCYIVEPHPPGTKLVHNGLPVFTLYYANDDDGERKIGIDSRLHFTAPADGAYLIRVSDSRNHSGDRFAYRLIVREAQPDFTVSLVGVNPTISPGSGQAFTLNLTRVDQFDGAVTVEITDVPSGFLVTSPIVIEAGHLQAMGSIHAAPDAEAPMKDHQIKITATADINGKTVTKKVNSFGTIKLGEAPKLLVAFEPYSPETSQFSERPLTGEPLEIMIAPGQTLPAWLKVKREGHDDLVTFLLQNLPHGVIVDNIGLNGVLIPKEESERQIFIRAAHWVPETSRLAFAQARQAGNPTSIPVRLTVRKSGEEQRAGLNPGQ